MAPVKALSDAVQLGAVTTKNRLCIPPMVQYSYAGADGVASEQHIQYYTELARGGAGLIIQEATAVTAEGRLVESQLGLWSDEQIPGLRRIVEAVHREGCPIFVQLHHAGVTGVGPRHLCPSPYRYSGRNGDVVGQEMTKADIREVEEAFIEAGSRAYEAGYDGVELHGCHSYLLCQFLNRRVNRRTDEFGRDPVQLVTNIMAGIRAKTSPAFVIGIRLGAFEPTLAEGIAHAKALEAAGIQFLDVSYGFAGEMEITAPGDPRLSAAIRGAAAVKAQVAVPVFGVAGIRTPEDARLALATGIDMVDIARSALVDPNWCQKTLCGETPFRCLDCKVCRWRQGPEKCPGRLLRLKKEGK